FINGHERYTKYVEARIGGGWVQEVAACGPTENPEQQEANARLIAAAPELLEALQSCIQQITALCSADDVPDQARAAIAKATA
ncbi:hypothetical protein AAIH74_35175, partial [Pseudomonas aeruginosa]